MRIVHTIAELHAALEEARGSRPPAGGGRTDAGAPAAGAPSEGARTAAPGGRARLALVPTMGALHEGHLSLVDRARERADLVAMSIFVNPIQFGPGEDFERYPRDLARDAELAEARGVDLLFAPRVEELYPSGAPIVKVTAGPLGERLCGAFRPGHFDGVLTVVAKLFHLFAPDVAIFGRKDFQQSVLIRRMVRDLDFPVEIDVAPTVREPDGLALSSRNAYLSPEERQRALALYRGLTRGLEAFRGGERAADRLRGIVADAVEAEPGTRLQYVELVDPDTLDPLVRAEPGSVIALAAFVGDTRLIDNIVLT